MNNKTNRNENCRNSVCVKIRALFWFDTFTKEVFHTHTKQKKKGQVRVSWACIWEKLMKILISEKEEQWMWGS